MELIPTSPLSSMRSNPLIYRHLLGDGKTRSQLPSMCYRRESENEKRCPSSVMIIPTLHTYSHWLHLFFLPDRSNTLINNKPHVIWTRVGLNHKCLHGVYMKEFASRALAVSTRDRFRHDADRTDVFVLHAAWQTDSFLHDPFSVCISALVCPCVRLTMMVQSTAVSQLARRPDFKF